MRGNYVIDWLNDCWVSSELGSHTSKAYIFIILFQDEELNVSLNLIFMNVYWFYMI